jgi:hypothetical protein
MIFMQCRPGSPDKAASDSKSVGSAIARVYRFVIPITEPVCLHFGQNVMGQERPILSNTGEKNLAQAPKRKESVRSMRVSLLF